MYNVFSFGFLLIFWSKEKYFHKKNIGYTKAFQNQRSKKKTKSGFFFITVINKKNELSYLFIVTYIIKGN